MIVDAEIWHWTKDGMRRGPMPTLTSGFIRVRDVEQLLTEADGRRLCQERQQRDDEFERRRDTGEP